MDFNSSFVSWFSSLEKQTQKEIKNTIKDGLIKSGKFDTWKACQFAEHSKFLSEKYGTELFKQYELYLGVENSLNFFEEKMCKQIYDSNRSINRRL